MGRKSEDEDNTCPSCGYKDVFDATLSYDRTLHELHELDKYEVHLLYKEYKEKRGFFHSRCDSRTVSGKEVRTPDPLTWRM